MKRGKKATVKKSLVLGLTAVLLVAFIVSVLAPVVGALVRDSVPAGGSRLIQFSFLIGIGTKGDPPTRMGGVGLSVNAEVPRGKKEGNPTSWNVKGIDLNIPWSLRAEYGRKTLKATEMSYGRLSGLGEMDGTIIGGEVTTTKGTLPAPEGLMWLVPIVAGNEGKLFGILISDAATWVEATPVIGGVLDLFFGPFLELTPEIIIFMHPQVFIELNSIPEYILGLMGD